MVEPSRLAGDCPRCRRRDRRLYSPHRAMGGVVKYRVAALEAERDALHAEVGRLKNLLRGAIQSMATHGNELTNHADNLDAAKL